MAITAEELRILVRAETKNAQRELERFRKQSKKTGIDVKKLAMQLAGGVGLAVGFQKLASIVKSGISSMINYAASIEQTTVAFEVLTGSARVAEKTLEELRQFSVKTPFTFEELTPAAKRLLAFGTEAKDVVATMEDLGNASMGNSEILGRLVDAYGKVQAKGRASLEELNRFTEAGVPLMRQLATDLGLTTEELFKFVSQGKVGFEEVNTALQNLTRGEGQFAGMLDRQSTTMAGAMSTLKGAVQDLGLAFSRDLIPYLTQTLIVITDILNAGAKKRQLENIFDEMFEPFELEGNKFEQAEQAFDQMVKLYKAREELERIINMNRGMRTSETRFSGARSKEELRATLYMVNSLVKNAEEMYNELAGSLPVNLPNQVQFEDTGEGAGAAAADGFVHGFTKLLQYAETSPFDVFFPSKDESAAGGEEAAEAYVDGFTKLIEYAESNPFDVFFPTADGFVHGFTKLLQYAETSPFDVFFPSKDESAAEGEEAAEAYVDGFTKLLQYAETSPFDVFFPTKEEAAAIARELREEMWNVMEAERATPIPPALTAADFGKPELEGLIPTYDALTESVYGLELGLGRLIKETGPKLTEELIEQQEKAKELKQWYEDLADSMIQSFASTAGSAVMTALEDITAAMFAIENGSQAVANSIADLIQALISALPRLFLTAALEAFIAQQWELGLGLLAAAGLSAIASGAIKGARDRERAMSEKQAPSPADVTAAAQSHRGDMVTINYNGDVFTRNEREATTMATVRRAGGNR